MTNNVRNWGRVRIIREIGDFQSFRAIGAAATALHARGHCYKVVFFLSFSRLCNSRILSSINVVISFCYKVVIRGA